MSKSPVTLPVLVDVDESNLEQTPCCGIKDPAHPGVCAKRGWLKSQLACGLKARYLVAPNGGTCAYIEYLPGEYGWRGVSVAGYMLIHCLWNHVKRHQGKGYGRALVEACLGDAKAAGMKGVAVVSREGPWLAGRSIYLRNGFEVADTAAPDYQLLVRKFRVNAAAPKFAGDFERKAAEYGKGLTIVRSAQCPYIAKFSAEIAACAQEEYHTTPKVVELETCEDAQAAPTPYAVFSLLYGGRVVADHQVSRTRFRNIMRKLTR